MACYGNVIYGPTVDTTPGDILNATIPTTGHPKLEIQAIYGDDNVQIAYYEHTLSIDTIIYYNNTVAADLEDEASRLEKILLTPGYQLKLNPVGLGNYPVVNGTGGKADMAGGPFPQQVTVEPIASNNAIAIRWVVMFRIDYCADTASNMVQFNSELDFNVDEEGDLVFNLRVTYQQRTPILDISNLNPLVNALSSNAGASFQGMHRRKRVSLTRDQRTARIHIEFKEIKSDNPYFQNTKAIDFVDDISSDLFGQGMLSGRGFYTWNRKFSASITLPARIHKSYAWIVFLKIIQQRFRNLSQLTKKAALLEMGQTDGQDNTYNTKNWYLLTRIRITNPVYTRTMKFEAEYFVVTDLDTLLSKTQICSRVNNSFNDDPGINNPPTLSDQWKVWSNANNISLNGVFELEPNNVPITYNQCSGAYSAPRVANTALGAAESDPDIAASPDETNEKPPKQEDTKYSWLDYSNEVELVEKTKNVHVSYLQAPPSTSYYQTDDASASATANRSAEGMVINGRYTSAAGTTKAPKTVARGTSTFEARMKGYAIRVGHKIPIPVLTSVGGSPVSRSGEARFVQKQISRGDVPVYLAMWDIPYSIDKDIHSADIMNAIKSSGVPGHYL